MSKLDAQTHAQTSVDEELPKGTTGKTVFEDLQVTTGRWFCKKTKKWKRNYRRLGQKVTTKDGGVFYLIDPLINMSAVLEAQNRIARAEGKDERDKVMASIFDKEDLANTDEFKAKRKQMQSQKQDKFSQQFNAEMEKVEAAPTPQRHPQQEADAFDNDIPF